MIKVIGAELVEQLSERIAELNHALSWNRYLRFESKLDTLCDLQHAICKKKPTKHMKVNDKCLSMVVKLLCKFFFWQMGTFFYLCLEGTGVEIKAVMV